MKTYSEKLRDPRWQRKRLEVMERDSFKCTQCGDKKSTLNIHHWKYTKNPWDAPNSDLSTVCESCHRNIEVSKELTNSFIKHFDFRLLLEHINRLLQKHEVKFKFDEDEILIYKRDVLSEFDDLIDSPPNIDSSNPYYEFESCDGFTLNSPYGFIIHKGVFIQWDISHTERITNWIDTLDEDALFHLVAATFHKGSIALAWRKKIPSGFSKDEWVSPPCGDSWFITDSTCLK